VPDDFHNRLFAIGIPEDLEALAGALRGVSHGSEDSACLTFTSHLPVPPWFRATDDYDEPA
jgi:hypothetical protein